MNAPAAITRETAADELAAADAALFNILTLVDAVDRDAAQLAQADSTWPTGRVHSCGEQMHRLCMVLRDEQERAKDAVQRLLDLDA